MKSILYTQKPNMILPKELIYPVENRAFYSMGSTVTGEKLGEMRAFPVSRPNQEKNYLNITSLLMRKKRQGYGTKFLNFAVNLSKQNGCHGRVKLIAGTTPYDLTPPHTFYRKYGFDSYDKKSLRIIDKAIKRNRELYYTEVPQMRMFYPAKPKPNLWQRFIQKLLRYN